MRSVRARMLGISLLIAVVAVAATAWLVNRTTSAEVRTAVEADEETVDAIYEALSFYAFTHRTWEDVEPLVAGLAERYDQRVALTTLAGEVMVDTAVDSGDGAAPLPDTPAGFIDPSSPVISFDTPTGLPAELLDGLTLPDPAELASLGRAVAAALEEAGIPYTFREGDFGIGFPEIDVGDPDVGAVIERALEGLLADPAAGGVPALGGLFEGLGETLDGLAGFFDERGIPHTVEEGPLGLPMVEWDYSDPEATRALVEFFAGLEGGGLLDGLFAGSAETAEPALLFLGFDDVVAVTASPVGWRLLAAVALVAVVAVLLTVMASRRVLGPIAALTGAAQRLQRGALSERVPVRGSDELAELAGAFNSMAASLEEQDRLRRTMTGDIAHELRTPLANVRGYLEAVQEGVVEPTPELVASLHEETLALQQLIDDLQELSLAEAGELAIRRADTDLPGLVAQVVQARRGTAEAAGVSLGVEGSSDVTVAVDPVRIRQVVANLVDNALRHTGRGGSVRVRVTRVAGWAVVEVADNGTGIAPEHVPHVFDRFYRADPSRSRESGGSGLGLAIARELVRLHSGDISVTSTLGEGTTVTVRLPLRAAGPTDEVARRR